MSTYCQQNNWKPIAKQTIRHPFPKRSYVPTNKKIKLLESIAKKKLDIPPLNGSSYVPANKKRGFFGLLKKTRFQLCLGCVKIFWFFEMFFRVISILVSYQSWLSNKKHQYMKTKLVVWLVCFLPWSVDFILKGTMYLCLFKTLQYTQKLYFLLLIQRTFTMVGLSIVDNVYI